MTDELDPAKFPQEFIDFWRFLKEFDGESERAAVVLGAARLDRALLHLLTNALLPHAAGRDPLFRFEGPLGTFSGKIDMAHRLGLFDAGFCRALHLIRKIRNSFAHDGDGVSLSRPPHQDRVREIAHLYRNIPVFADALGRSPLGNDPPGVFRMAVIFLGMKLESRANEIARTSQWSPLTLAG